MASRRAVDRSKLSTDPKQIRNRLRRRSHHFQRDLELYIANGGIKPLEEWDLEELARGRPRDKRGKFGGRAPSWVMPNIHQEAKRRLFQHAYGGMAAHLDMALRTIVRLMNCRDVDDNGRPIVDPGTQLKAAMFIVEHIIGKPKNRVEIEASDSVKEFLADALVLADGTPAHPVIDGQFDEEEDDDDDSEL